MRVELTSRSVTRDDSLLGILRTPECSRCSLLCILEVLVFDPLHIKDTDKGPSCISPSEQETVHVIDCVRRKIKRKSPSGLIYEHRYMQDEKERVCKREE